MKIGFTSHLGEEPVTKEMVDRQNSSLSLNVGMYNLPQPLWKWSLFGDDAALVIFLYRDVSILRRIATRLIFGSTWTSLKPKQYTVNNDVI